MRTVSVLSSTLLDALTLSGTVVTIDAMGCQKSIAGKIVSKEADYILAGRQASTH
jgi:predicted transposase YbfD/YdcC